LKNLNAMVTVISHDIIPLLVNNNTRRMLELSNTVSLRPKNPKKASFFIEDLNAVVGGVSHQDLIVSLVDSHTIWTIKLAISQSI